MRGESRRGSGVNACKTLVGPKNGRGATRLNVASRFELPLLGSNQDSPDPERRPQGNEKRQIDREWRPDEHWRPVGLTSLPARARRNACKTLAESSGRLS